ncbi:MAG: hypothetical protein Q8P89_02145 [bacterium]|nr:hypothetical protein [bacterium]
MEIKKIIGPLQSWLLSGGRCVGCGVSLAKGKRKPKDGQEMATYKCGRVFIPRRENHDRKVVDEAIQINSAEGEAQGGRKTMGVSPWKFIFDENNREYRRALFVEVTG